MLWGERNIVTLFDPETTLARYPPSAAWNVPGANVWLKLLVPAIERVTGWVVGSMLLAEWNCPLTAVERRNLTTIAWAVKFSS